MRTLIILFLSVLLYTDEIDSLKTASDSVGVEILKTDLKISNTKISILELNDSIRILEDSLDAINKRIKINEELLK